jgi:hypothetical protein
MLQNIGAKARVPHLSYGNSPELASARMDLYIRNILGSAEGVRD